MVLAEKQRGEDYGEWKAPRNTDTRLNRKPVSEELAGLPPEDVANFVSRNLDRITSTEEAREILGIMSINRPDSQATADTYQAITNRLRAVIEKTQAEYQRRLAEQDQATRIMRVIKDTPDITDQVAVSNGGDWAEKFKREQAGLKAQADHTPTKRPPSPPPTRSWWKRMLG